MLNFTFLSFPIFLQRDWAGELDKRKAPYTRALLLLAAAWLSLLKAVVSADAFRLFDQTSAVLLNLYAVVIVGILLENKRQQTGLLFRSFQTPALRHRTSYGMLLQPKGW